MKTAVISFTEKGRRLSVKTGGDRYCFCKHCDEGAVSFENIHVLMSDIFSRYDAFVFVCAAGIAVRAIAPHIVSKLCDPAVVAVDDSGRYAVSLLSGHIGGANALARRVAAAVGAVPVITTATDSGGLFSPDIFAKANGLVICGMSEAKAVAAALVNGETVGVKCAYPHSAFPPELEERGSGSIGIVISDSDDEKPFDITLNLIPKNLAVGIGCKKDISAAAVTEHIMRTFSENRLDIRRLSICATIDIKAEEKGLKRFCDMFGLPLGTYTAEELMEAKGEFAHSGFVEKTVGADNVCERAAVCAGGTLIVGKTKGNGVTCAVSELPVYIDPESGE